MTRARIAAALAAALGGLAVAVGLGLRQYGPLAGPEAAPLYIVDARPAVLDTVRIRGRRVTASLNGTVTEVDGEGTVWLGTGGDAFPIRLPDGAGLAVEDRALVVGRLRGQGGRRWVEASGWARVTGHPR